MRGRFREGEGQGDVRCPAKWRADQVVPEVVVSLRAAKHAAILDAVVQALA